MSATEQSLAGKVAVVTGAGRGIGRAIAVGYAAAGAAVVAQGIQERGGRAMALPVDVTDPVTVEALFAETVQHFGGIDIGVINAGVSLDRRTVAESVPDDWRMTLEVNLFGAYHCAKAALPHLKARGAGKIIMIGSGMGHRSGPGSSAYACSKAGLWIPPPNLPRAQWRTQRVPAFRREGRNNSSPP